ncbi:MAG: ketoacyl-ACP synthase III [Proteobacteria bacterium]|nr:ketoacyl-ACP synthase III [Pseudomonadota bacterium]
MKYSKIIGVGSYLPETILTNAELEKIVDTTDEWIFQRVGIRERHVIGVSQETVSSMAVGAAHRALAASQLTAANIDMVVVCTTTSDYLFPSVACIVQQQLGIKNNCPAFDLNAACAGFIYGISVVDQFIKTNSIGNALIIGVDALTKTVDWNDRSTCVLFGDGAGAIILQQSSDPGVLSTHIHADGSYVEALYSKSPLWNSQPANIHMKGNTVFKIAVTQLGNIVEQTLAKSGLKKTDVNWLIPHQANARIIEAIAKRLDLSMDRVILTVAEHGNTSAASVPLALDHALQTGKIKRGDVLMLEAFGAGLAWGSALIKY